MTRSMSTSLAVLLLSLSCACFTVKAVETSVDEALAKARQMVRKKRDLRDAISLMDGALGQLGSAGSLEERAQAHNLRSVAASYLSDWKVAEQSARESVKLRESQWPNGPNHALALGSLGGILSRTRPDVEARDTLNLAVEKLTPWMAPERKAELQRALGDSAPQEIALAGCGLLSNLASAERRLVGQEGVAAYERSEDAYKKAIACYQASSLKNYFGEGSALGNLGSLYVDWPERFHLAEIVLMQVQRFRSQHKDPGLAHTFNELGRFYFQMGDLARSHKAFLLALDLWKRTDSSTEAQGTSDAIARGEVNLGILLRKLGYEDRARDAFLRSKRARPAMASLLERSATYEALVGAQLDLAERNSANTGRAREWLLEFGAFAPTGDGSAEARRVAGAYHRLMSRLQMLVGNRAAAEMSARAAVAAFDAIPTQFRGEREWMDAKRWLAVVLVESGRVSEGVAQLKQMRDSLRPDARANNNIKIPVHHDLAWALGQYALTLKGEERDRALEVALVESDIAMSEIDALVRPRLPFTCGDLQLESGDDYQPVIQLAVLLRLLLVSDRNNASGQLDARSVELLQGAVAALDLGQAADGAAITRGALFRELRTDAERDAWRIIEASTAARCLEIRAGSRDISSGSRADSDSAIARRVAEGEAMLGSEVRRLVEEARRPATLTALKARLGDRVGLVQYVIGKDAAFAVLMSREAVRVVPLSTNAMKLRGDVSAMREGPLLERAVCSETYVGLSRRLYKELMAPVRTASGEHLSQLIIVPTGDLAQLPFAALSIGAADNPSPDAAGCGERWLAGELDLTVVPSLGSVLSSRESRDGPKPLHAYVGVLGPSSKGAVDVGPTASVTRAVREMGRLFPSSRSRVLEGATATPTAVLEAGALASVLHIGAHGEWGGDRVDTVEPFLILAPDSKDPRGLLTASGIAGANLSGTRIVILSACKTAVDESPRFGTLAALPKGFFAAGVNVVVPSLWSVDADATAELTLAFAKNAIAGTSTPRALARAQTQVASDPRWRHPFFWAGFVHLGAPLAVADAAK